MGNLAVAKHFEDHREQSRYIPEYPLAPEKKVAKSYPLVLKTREQLEEILRWIVIGGRGELFEENLKMGMYRPDLVEQSYFKKLRYRYNALIKVAQ